MKYLTCWRMLLAGHRLTNSTDSISVIAFSLGYESESAFSTAFKRVMGRSPRRYSRDRNPEPLYLARGRHEVRSQRTRPRALPRMSARHPLIAILEQNQLFKNGLWQLLSG
jgi:hypothetical protein